jgi:hypothetical protein
LFRQGQSITSHCLREQRRVASSKQWLRSPVEMPPLPGGQLTLKTSPPTPNGGKGSTPNRGYKALPWVLLGLWSLVIFNFAANSNSPEYPTDDGYISFSYAQTLAKHGSLTLTAGARHVQGYSNFLWVIVLAAARFIGLSIPTASRVLATICVLLLVPATYVLARRLSPGGSRLFAGTVAAIVGVLPGGIFFALSGITSRRVVEKRSSV